MKILRFDSVGGASGDMILASLLGLGVDADELQKRLSGLGIERFNLRFDAVSDHGMQGCRLFVEIPDDESHPHRHLSDIQNMIRTAAESGRPHRLSPTGAALADSVFKRLAEAEAAVHGTTPEQVHFHEVGAMDSIVDIVGACEALSMLAVDAVDVSPLPVGRGSTVAAHGSMPLPVPATATLLKGHPVVATEEPFELVTPTGAALLMTWKDELGASSETTALPVGSANAFGHRSLSRRQNLLRASLLETTAGADTPPGDVCRVLECNLDDMVPELFSSLVPRLLEAGALDVYTTGVLMKKQRPGVLLSVLCKPPDAMKLKDIVFRETTTFGIREYQVERTILTRRVETASTPYGPVRIKVGTWNGDDITRSPEYTDCESLARENDIPVRAVYEAALRGIASSADQ